MDGLIDFAKDDDGDRYKRALGASDPREKTIQIIVSLLLGVTAFLTFCVLRPRWAGLYAARKKVRNEAAAVPELPDSLFGWIVPLWRITDQQILAAAGLDAFAFLAFFKMAMKFLAVALFFSLIVIKPVHDAHPEPENNSTRPDNRSHHNVLYTQRSVPLTFDATIPRPSLDFEFENDYLWMYLAFAYLFSSLVLYLVFSTTRRIIEVRQEYLGAKNSITDRTIRLSGIPLELRDEESIKQFIESLDIGKVESVTLCRNWKELDEAVNERMNILRRLEEAYTTYAGRGRIERNFESLPIVQPTPPSPRAMDFPEEEGEIDDEDTALIGLNGRSIDEPHGRTRPTTRIRYGFLKIYSRQVDAINHFQEQLEQADDRIRALRQKEFTATPLAFVTMNSVSACQMAIQAVLDPSPLQLIANQSPEPGDVIWSNTYISRRSRIIRAWCVTSLIVLLTVFWVSIFGGVAGLLSVESIGKVFPQLEDLLKEHKNARSLVNAQLPTLITSLLLVLVPYLYYWLSWYQGFMSQCDLELSAISKNFFFTFFNFFLVFTVLGTSVKYFEIFQRLGDAFKNNIKNIANTLATSLQDLSHFYVNFIILQGLGLFPVRLLEVGSVSLYPIFRMGAKTPRDYAELVQPPIFSYGFYLPNALLIFIICMVYSVLRSSWQILLAGLIYFAFGYFVYKYQLLYAMDSQHQATGQAWMMICDRIFVGLIFFQLATTGQLLLRSAVPRSVLVIPLVVATVWIWIAFGRTYKPLMKFIALRSVKQGEQYTDHESLDADSTSSTDLAPERRAWAGTDASQLDLDQERGNGSAQAAAEVSETGLRFINPSLVAPLHPIWIADKHLRREGERLNGDNSV